MGNPHVRGAGSGFDAHGASIAPTFWAGGQEREYNDRVKAAKTWMQEQRIPKHRSDAAME